MFRFIIRRNQISDKTFHEFSDPYEEYIIVENNYCIIFILIITFIINLITISLGRNKISHIFSTNNLIICLRI
jgi:hypothetical protein